jgi:hypothetical protein
VRPENHGFPHNQLFRRYRHFQHTVKKLPSATLKIAEIMAKNFYLLLLHVSCSTLKINSALYTQMKGFLWL